MIFKKFITLVILYFIISYITNFFLVNDELFIIYLGDEYTTKYINDFLSSKKKWEWISYTIIPLFLLIKTTLISSILYIGTFFYSKKKVVFKQLFHITIIAEFLFLLVGVAKVIWFYFFQTTYTLEDLQYFYPLSALNIVGFKGLEAWFIYPLQTINLFELAYWLLLSYYIGKIASPTKNGIISKYPIDFGLKIVASSYGSALLLWVVVVMFFTLNNS
jgi:hypothetical protein